MGQVLSGDQRQRLIQRAGLITIAINLGLTIARAAAGYIGGSTAVLADAANSGTDILATLVVLGGARIAALPPDQDHPYGHEKAEPVAAKVVGLVVLITGVVTALGAVQAIRTGGATEPVGLVAAYVTGGSMIVKEFTARFLLGAAKQTDSQALTADAANQRADVFTSAAALAGVLGARLGFPLLDPIMGILVAALIVKVGFGLYWEAVQHLMDPSPDTATMATLERVTGSVPGVVSVDTVKARRFGVSIYVDCKICVDQNLTVQEGHHIAGQVRAALKEEVPTVKDVLVHVNPCRVGQGEDSGRGWT